MVAGVNRERRVAALEERHQVHKPVSIPLIAAEAGETAEQAVGRHVATNGPLALVDRDQVNAIVLIPKATPRHSPTDQSVES